MTPKNIKFVYYCPCSKKNVSDIINIDSHLYKLSTGYNDYCINLSNGSSIRVNYVEKHTNLFLNGYHLKYDLWEIHFIKSLLETPVKYDIDTCNISDLDLNDNERVAERNVLLYDPITKIIVISKNIKGATTANIRDFINLVITEQDNKIDFIPVIDDSELDMLLDNVFHINFRLKTTMIPEVIKYEDDNSMIDTFKSMNTLQNDPNDILKAEVNISLENNRKHNRYLGTKVIPLINTLKTLLSNKVVDKLRVKTIDVNTNKVAMIDLIENTIYDEDYFEIDINKRCVEPHNIFMKMVSKYDARRNKYLIE